MYVLYICLYICIFVQILYCMEVLCEPVRWGTQVLGMLCTRCFFFFFLFFAFWFGFGRGRGEGKRKKRKEEKRKEEDTLTMEYGRTLVVACLTHPTKKKNQIPFFPTVGRYLLYNVSSYTHTYTYTFLFFFPKILLSSFLVGTLFFGVQLFPFPPPSPHPSPGKKRETDFFPIQSVHKPCLPHT